MSWNALQSGEDLDNFFDGIYKRSQSRKMRPPVEDTTDPASDPHDYIQALPGVEEYPLWCIGCRVRLSLQKLKKYM